MLRLLWSLLALTLGVLLLAAWPALREAAVALPAPAPDAGIAGPVASGPQVRAAAPAEGGAPEEATAADDVADGAPSPGAERDGGLLAALAPVRVTRPVVPAGPRRIGIQAGHWQTAEVPEELRRLEHATGTAGGGVQEWQLNLEVARRVAATLRDRGYQVDILPTTVPEGYVADVFLAIHADGSTDATARGFKAAHGNRRGPYEGQLVTALAEEYGRATGLPVDPLISRNMRGYYAFSWSRFKHTVAPHTPAAILEMGFLTNAADRTVLLGRQDAVAGGIASGVQRFLDEVPAGVPFAEDLVLPPALPFRTVSATAPR